MAVHTETTLGFKEPTYREGGPLYVYPSPKRVLLEDLDGHKPRPRLRNVSCVYRYCNICPSLLLAPNSGELTLNTLLSKSLNPLSSR
jgi:hypothetical protein